MKRDACVASVLAVVGGGLAVVALAWLGWAWYESRLPATYSVMDYAIPDDGGAPLPEPMAGHAMHGGVSVAEPARAGRASRSGGSRSRRRRPTVRLASGRTVEALSFNGTLPGPELRVRQGDLVEVTLRNRDVDGRRHDPLARRRPAERRGRRRRRDPGRRPPGRELRLPLPRHPGRDVLVPHAPGIVRRGAPRPLRRARDRAATAAAPASGGAPTSPSPSTRSTARRSSTRPTASSGAPSRRARRCGSG